MLIEIEQEGTGDDYFAFYTGGGYSVPSAGAELTIHSACDVCGDWVKFENLDSGAKPEPAPETGTISGSVFCDIDCDGIDGSVTTIPGETYVVEAEHMWRSGFTTFSGSEASGGKGVKLAYADGQCTLKTTFAGAAGVYDVTIRVQDENDGKSIIKLLVDGKLVEAVRLDRDSDGGGSDKGGFSSYVIPGVSLKAGSEVRLWVDGDKGEFVRIDNISFEGEAKVVRAPEPSKEGLTVFLLNADGASVLDATGEPVRTVTDAAGNFAFTNVPVGDYRVKFESPEGSEFTFKDKGTDDTIDSDVDKNGLSDIFTVTAKSVIDVDAGVNPTPIDAVNDTITVLESEGAGDVDINVLANDAPPASATGPVLKVEGQTANVGEWIDLAGGGRVRIDANGDLDFDANGDFDSLNGGESAQLSLTYTIGRSVVTPAETVHLDFNGLARGTLVSNQFAANGVTISSANALNPVMIFDTANPTGGDFDLATSNFGKALILSEDRDSNDPDDNAGGGTFVFTFDRPADLASLTFLDTEEPRPQMRFFDAEGALITTIAGPVTPDGGQAVANFTVSSVARLEVQLKGSGAIDNLNYSVPGGETIDKEDTATITIIVEGEDDPAGSLSGRYFVNENRDGVDNDEPGVEGVLVELLGANGAATGATTTTAADGSYSFAGLVPGTYGVKFIDTVSGKTLIASNVGADDAIGSDAIDLGGGMSQILGIVVAAGQDTPDNDAGVETPLGSIEGRYFCDNNHDGLDNDDHGVANRAVNLLQAGADGIFGTADDVILATTKTDGNGEYRFDGLEAGDYAVQIIGANFVTKDLDGNLSDDIDSDVNANGITDAITLAAGQHIANVDAGTGGFEVPADGLIGVSQLFAGNIPPLITFNNTGVTSYDAETDSFTVSGRPLLSVTAAPVVVSPFPTTGRLLIDIEVDETGAVVGGAADDFILFNDLDNNGVVDAGEAVFLQGRVLALGSQDGAATDLFDVIIEIEGGTLAAGFDPLIGLAWSSEQSTFADDFTVGFTGQAKGQLGSIDIDCIC